MTVRKVNKRAAAAVGTVDDWARETLWSLAEQARAADVNRSGPACEKPPARVDSEINAPLPLCVLGPGGDFRTALPAKATTDRGRESGNGVAAKASAACDPATASAHQPRLRWRAWQKLALARFDAALRAVGVGGGLVASTGRPREQAADWPLVILGPQGLEPVM